MATVEAALTALWTSVLTSLPNVVLAVITLVVGFILGRLGGRIVREVLERADVDKYVSKHEHMNIDITGMAALVAKWVIYLAFIKQATLFLGIAAITDLFNSILLFVPGVVEAVVVILVGYALALYLKEQVITSKSIYSDVVGKTVFFLIVYLSIALALPFVGVNPTVVNNVLLVIMGSVGLGFAIAIGFGLRDVVAAAAKDYTKKFRGRRR